MNVKSELLANLANAGGDYISGAALADKLGVSRNAVWKAVKALEAEGFSISSITSKGYKLNEDNNRLSEDLISPLLTTKEMGRNIMVLEEVDSTNNVVRELETEKAPHGTTVIADRQTAGKGRIGRSFVSPQGAGLYMSVLVRPHFDLEFAPMITAAAACAAAEAVESLCGSKVNIKWVNDLYMNGKKICGILTEASLGLELRELDCATIGIGINVRSIGKSFDSELKKKATSIEDETGIRINRNRLCAEVLNRLEPYLGKITDRSFLKAYREREMLTGHRITAMIGNEQLEGEALGIDENANLIIRLPYGEIKYLSSGEANLCRIADQ
ncbi:biotin--[acetyl-CoA-carboxylase] ligase [uncultured Ruminococcus sp.]|jgi:BirA family biotin operon repressor/biotin-[acetyl-CoA-carboxylase] ligase|uniref:biotin--[acetyl-CoA-carboxylase] ligase n=1 Tax=uncultured Ruminococcus sp. TaxID=165186 RepID=UPI0025E0ED69|nr:biotin--[acetyl-CoA-carboxylase] ligase [uncultured Ruminococcus sp.]